MCRDVHNHPPRTVQAAKSDVTPFQINLSTAYRADFTPATAKSAAAQLQTYGKRVLAKVVQRYADVLIKNANIYTMDPKNPRATALTIKGNQIAYVGDDKKAAEQIGPNTKIIDAAGQTVTPGFQDSHAHLLYIVELNSWTVIRGMNKQQMIRALQESEPINGWIKCFGAVLTRDEIDAALKAVGKEHVPVYMESATGEYSSVNTPAIKRIEEFHGLDIEGPHPGKNGRLPTNGHGWIELDRGGRPTGRLRYANVLVHAGRDGKSEGPMPCASYAQIKEHFTRTLAYMSKNGITQFHNAMSTLPELAIYRKYEQEVGLPMRIYSSHGMSQFKIHTEVDKEFLSRMLELKEKYNSDMFNIGGVKFNVSPSAEGGLSYSLEELTTFISRLNKAGIQAWIHAISEDEIELCLDAFAAADPKGEYKHLRHRIEHFCAGTESQVKRAASLGVAAAVQPEWNFPATEAKEHGMVTGLGTDWDVIPDINPMRQMAAAVEQGLTPYEAVQRYTVHPAVASHTEDRLGMIEAGKLADVVMLDQDLVAAKSPRELARAKVTMTICDGKIVHRDPRVKVSSGD